MDWRKRYAGKIRTAEEAVADVQSGQAVTVAMFDGMPVSLCNALRDRAPELEDVTIFHFVSAYPWFSFNDGKSFRHVSPYTTNVDRGAMRDGSAEYLPAALWRQGRLPYGVGPFDYHLCVVSPPDAEGYCSFGSSVWMNPTFAANSRVIIAEVDEHAIRTGGANKIHVDRIDRLVDPEPAVRAKVREAMTKAAVRSDEETAAAEVICTVVAAELVNDGDTVQIGAGAISAALAPCLSVRSDLGIHTELLTGGVAELARTGVVNGSRKSTHPGKIVATGVSLVPAAELEFIDGNPMFELYDFTYTDDIDVLSGEPRLVAVNNAMQVDLTGQINSESIGPWPYTGPGGQTAFAIAAAHSEAGRSVIVLPSSYVKDGQRRSRIVATLDEAAPVTVPRTAVDYIVTEYGIATMRGKSLRQRIDELLSVTHPDCRAAVEEEAKRVLDRA